jgi:hypothetical protein
VRSAPHLRYGVPATKTATAASACRGTNVENASDCAIGVHINRGGDKSAIELRITHQHPEWLRPARRSFASPREVRDAINRFIEADNERAVSFEWSKGVLRSFHPMR